MQNRTRHILILGIFFVSGGVGLLYEVTWSRQLQLIFGSIVFSISAVLSAFFIGMALGSYTMGRWGSRTNPLRLYSLLELILGLFVLVFPLLFKLVDAIYLSVAPLLVDRYLLGQAIKFILSFILLFVPCALMGGTLPVLSRAIAKTPENRSSRIGSLYAANTLGAVAGAAGAGFFLIERLGLTRVVLAGGITNLVLAGSAFLLSLKCKEKVVVSTHLSTRPVKPNRWPLLLYGISGFCALAYEVLFTRALMQTFISSTYAFSAILILFLAGIALGSSVMSIFIDKITRPALGFALLQVALALSVIFGMSILITTWLPLFLPTLIMGALFPVTVKWASGDTEIGFGVGKVYAANTLGGVIGVVAAAYILIPALGIRNGLLSLLYINLAVGFGLLIVCGPWKKPVQRGTLGLATIAAAVIIGFAVPSHLFFSGMEKDFSLLFYREGPVANVAVYQCKVPGRDFKILKTNNVFQSGGTDKHAMMVQKRQGHLPLLLHEKPDSVLVIGLATGVTLAAVAEHAIKRIDCIEIVPAQLHAIRFFEKENQAVFSDPRVRIIVDDGRSFIRTTPHRYDVIIGDLFQVKSAGTGNLYALEHVQACRTRLKENGLMVQWFPMQQLSEQGFKSAVKSFARVFPHVQFWFIDTAPRKPVIGLVASFQPVRLDIDIIRRRIIGAGTKFLDSGFHNPFFFVSQCIMQDQAVRSYIKDALPNTYDRPFIEFNAPRQKKERSSLEIINSLMKIESPLVLEAQTDADLEKMRYYARSHYQNLMAQLAFEMEQWEKAEVLLEKTLLKTPRNPDTKRLLGRTKIMRAAGLIPKGKYELALQKLDSAQALGIDDVFLFNLRKTANQMQTQIDADKKDQLPE
jgi:spermidine synthase